MIHPGRYTYEGPKGKLIDCPNEVTGNFWCNNHELTSLAGCPSSVGGHFYCSHNNLTSLAGCPSSVGGAFNCCYNKLTSLASIHAQLKSSASFWCTGNKIKSNILGLLLVTNLCYIDGDGPAFEIVQKWIGKGKSAIFRCQKELIDAGYEECAKL